jgi:hypothetical protein
MGTRALFKVTMNGKPMLGMWQNMDGYPTGWMYVLPVGDDGWQNCYPDYEYELVLGIGEPEFKISSHGDVLWRGMLTVFLQDTDQLLEKIWLDETGGRDG